MRILDVEPYAMFCDHREDVTGALLGPVPASRLQLMRWLWGVKAWSFTLTLAWEDEDGIDRVVHREFTMDDGSQGGGDFNDPSVLGYVNEAEKVCARNTLRNYREPMDPDRVGVCLSVGPGGEEPVGDDDGALNFAMQINRLGTGPFALFRFPADGLSEMPFATFDIDGITMPLYTSIFLAQFGAVGGGSLTPTEFWENRRQDGTNPIWDSVSGSALITPADPEFYVYP